MSESGAVIQEFSRVLDFFNSEHIENLSFSTQDDREEFISKALEELNPATLPVEVVGIAVKASIMRLIRKYGSHNERVLNPLYVVIDITLKLIEGGFRDPSLALSVIEDALDLITIQWLQPLIRCFETRKTLTSRIEPNKNKGLILLRILNEAQRRMSKIRYSYFSGWFLTLISNLFPLSERSGVNLRGEFNSKNKVTAQTPDRELENKLEHLDSDMQALYSCISQLRESCSYPPSIIENSNLNIFKENLQKVLKALEKECKRSLELVVDSDASDPHPVPTDLCSTGSKRSRDHEIRIKIDNPCTISGLSNLDQFFLKIHTIEELFKTQYLSTALSSDKDDMKNPDSMEVEHNWIDEMSERALKCIDFNRPCDKQYICALNLAKVHEKIWVEWKKNSCQNLDLPIERVSEEGANKKVKLFVSDAVRRPDFVGTAELSQLWQLASRADEILKDPERRVQRTDVNDLLTPFAEQALVKDDPAGDSANSQKSSTDYSSTAVALPPSYLWSCCRVALRRNYNIFCSPKSLQTTGSVENSSLVRILLGNVEPAPRFRGVPNDSTMKRSAG